MHKDLRHFLRDLKARGWRVEYRKRSSHYRLLPPNGGPPLFMGGTPSDRRALLNCKAAVRRAERASA